MEKMSVPSRASSSSSDENITDETIELLNDKISNLTTVIEVNDEKTSKIIHILKTSTSSLGANYYWLVFIFMYAGIYFLQ